MAYADVDDVAVRLGRAVSDAAEEEQIEAWLDEAEQIIAGRIRDLAARIADGRITVATVALVEARAVVRKVKNPDGKQNERIDDYSYGLVEDAAKGEIFITDDEWALLLGTTASGSGAFTIRPAGWANRAQPWIPGGLL